MYDKVEKVIQAIRPAIQADNGDIFLRGVDEETGVVTVELVGACSACPASPITLKIGVERILKDRVPGVTRVENVGYTVDPVATPPDAVAKQSPVAAMSETAVNL